MSAVDFMSYTSSLRDVVRVLERMFQWFRWVVTEVAAAFRANDGSQPPRFIRRKCVNNDIFDPVGIATRTAAILVPFARSRPWLLGFLRFQRALVHPTAPQTIRTL